MWFVLLCTIVAFQFVSVDSVRSKDLQISRSVIVVDHCNELLKALRESHSPPPPSFSDREALSFAADEAAIDCHDRTIIILYTLCSCIGSVAAINFTRIDVCPTFISLPIYNADLLFQFRDAFVFNRIAREKIFSRLSIFS